MGNGDEQFCLRWNDFQESLTSTLADLREEEDFVDVTLVCDGEHIPAHKLILSACSDFFRKLLKRSPGPNPVIVLAMDDMSVDDVKNILRFMYNGEVEVRQAHLNTFLSVAEKLRVRGLCQSGGKSTPIPSTSSDGGGSGSKKDSQDSESPNHHHYHQSAKNHSQSSPKSERRSSVEPQSKRPRFDKEENSSSASIKQESHGGAPDSDPDGQRRPGGGGGGGGPGSESDDYQDYGFGMEGYDDGNIQSALMAGMGMGSRGMLDSAAAKGNCF